MIDDYEAIEIAQAIHRVGRWIAFLVVGVAAIIFSCASCAKPATARTAPDTRQLIVWVEADSIHTIVHTEFPFPPAAWAMAGECVAGLHIPPPVDSTMPVLYVFPGTRLTVHDPLIDSLANGTMVQPNLDAYAFVRHNVVGIAYTKARNPKLYVHEALHFWLWRSIRLSGHPDWVFDVCDPMRR